ncbi:dTDP-4-dehydrorhamnose 3,5-epimerase family protein [Francisella marina]|uniref:dTDP-4-dehydrorhamnose 3,5-epimerase n=1 Tax=Francisella marina TaxID=2249302 RepID=A0ABX5ZI27_9GAMM|nr:dTDP-4-dehydrorhamnose 3,5-epimerase family protein [Francisella marina]QEO57915.1 dTDP-4-keto-6-deoxy-D-glucose epimerase [Francisella marina]QEO59858.1 dTDP-4-keto-6-deoxy-D-glucose epimerase [Francisella marina]
MKNKFEIINTSISDLYVLQRNLVEDDRGYLERLYCDDYFKKLTSEKGIRQINHTLTKKKHSVRGMHFQHPPFGETKVISCLKGIVYDVAIDLRFGSPSFLKWHGELLSAENHRSLIIPEGFAHGFQTLTDDCELIYLHTEIYNSNSEGALHPLDPKLAIKWPHEISLLSTRDSNHPFIKNNFKGIKI